MCIWSIISSLENIFDKKTEELKSKQVTVPSDGQFQPGNSLRDQIIPWSLVKFPDNHWSNVDEVSYDYLWQMCEPITPTASSACVILRGLI